MKTLFFGFLLGLVVLPRAALSNEATIFGVYEDCVAVSSTVFVRSTLNPAQLDDIAAQAEAAASGLGFDQGLPAMIASLEENGIKNIEIQRQGDCNVRRQGKYVEAIVDYCDENIVNAQVYVDGAVFFQQNAPKLTLGDFISAAREKLDAANIFGDPRISLNNSTDCQNQATSG